MYKLSFMLKTEYDVVSYEGVGCSLIAKFICTRLKETQLEDAHAYLAKHSAYSGSGFKLIVKGVEEGAAANG
jgi:hypothetical protein